MQGHLLGRPVRSRTVSIDRLPLIAFGITLLAMWACAHYYVAHVVILPAPDQPVWAAYDSKTAARLVGWAVLGLAMAAALPLWGSSPGLQELVDRTEPLVRRSLPMWTIAALGGVALMIGVKGPLLFRAQEYLQFQAPRPLIVFATTPTPIYLMACGVLSARRPVLGRMLAFICAATLFAYGTRVFAAALVLYFVGRRLGGCRISWQGWLGSMMLLLALLPVPLISRVQLTHGLIPYASATWEQVASGGYFETIPVVVSSNLGFSVPLLCYVSRVHRITSHDMIVSLNPAPGSLAGWDAIAWGMRVHDFIPFSALGEWASFGGPTLLGFTLAWGLIVRLVIRSVSTNGSIMMLPLVAAELGLSVFTIVVSSQYNTRSVSRIFSMMIALALADRMIRTSIGWARLQMSMVRSVADKHHSLRRGDYSSAPDPS